MSMQPPSIADQSESSGTIVVVPVEPTAQAPMMTSKPKRGSKQFHSSLCSWYRTPCTCLLAALCPCIIYGQNQKVMLEKNGCVPDCLTYAFCSLFGGHACVGGKGRGILRNQRGIAGGCESDCCGHFFCSPCVLTQEKVELLDAGKYD
ncbi:PLAC8 family-domain-containing protein [Globomyces pollinis-pini]|nr:PLAC8 family-domain-containing protein [Globomyces pollinis-pini]